MKTTTTKQEVRCPNCGNHANRYYYQPQQVIETACPVCDYLMVSCSLTGQVLESYAPGIAVPTLLLMKSEVWELEVK